MSNCHGSAKCISGTVRIDNQERTAIIHNVHFTSYAGRQLPFGFVYDEKGGRVGVRQVNGVWYRYKGTGMPDDDVLIPTS